MCGWVGSWLEFLTAGELGIPRLVFLLGEQAEGPAALFVDHQHGARQAAFCQRLQDSGLVTTTVDSPDRAETLVYDALHRLARPDSELAVAAPVWRVPARSRTFAGRTALLDTLHDGLAGDPSAGVQVVHGMAGVGKTSLVLEYAHRHSQDYDLAWWIRAEQADLIAEQLADLAHALDLASPADSPAAAVARLLGALRGQARWLLVFDNAEDPPALAPFLPGGAGHVLVTSRNPRWDTVGAVVAVEEFTRAESLDLLRARVPGLSGEDAESIAEAMGDLPSVLDLAAAHLVEPTLTPARYLDLFHHHAESLLGGRDEAGGYPVPVAAAWRLAFTQLSQANPAAVQLLTVAAWLAPEPVPLTLCTEHPSVLPSPLAAAVADPLGRVELVGVLHRRALARIGPDSVLLQVDDAVGTRRLTRPLDGEWLRHELCATAADAADGVVVGWFW